MRKFDVVIALEGIADARKQWTKAKHEFDQGVNKVMSRLLHEAAANFMSAEEVSRACGLKPNQVRSMMRLNGLDPKRGKRALSATAAEALATNANLLGIAPHEMDLMSPLAYLPMGKALRQQLQDQTVSQVHELPDEHDYVIPLDFDALAERFQKLKRGGVVIEHPELGEDDLAEEIRVEACAPGEHSEFGLTKRNLSVVLGVDL